MKQFKPLQFIFYAALILVQTNNYAAVSHQSVDQLVEKAISEFNVPGIAIGIIKDGEVVHLKGYGIANIDSQLKVDEDTIFKIASNTKAFTAAALAILVDQGKLKWSDKVIQYLPEFKMYDPWVTSEFNIRDLLTHRSGLRIGAGDLMLWPEPTRFSRRDIIENLRYLKPVSSFRDKYAYDNLLYIVAGEVVAKISGESWETFIEKNIFTPLGMKNCFAGGVNTSQFKNLAAPHTIVDNKLMVNRPNLINNKTSLMAAAGGIKCSVKDLSKWLDLQLNGGKFASKKHLFSSKQRDLMWKPVTRLPLSKQASQQDKSHYRGYALGWRISDYHGYWKISHTGTLSGSMSQIIIIPDESLAIVILTNQQSSQARNSLAGSLLQRFLQVPQKNWIDYYKNINQQNKTQLNQPEILLYENLLENTADNNHRLGMYQDPWFGKISILKNNKQTLFSSEKSPRLKGKVYYLKKNHWWVKWDDRSFEADSFLHFSEDAETGKISMKMEAISSDTDFSFDFKDLDFTKLSQKP